ncbi:MAG TPA: ATP-binding protein [Bryobacteraceae bacterium]|nr:ATP-binding protein [Bryobacteraceae bacterium]
MTIRRRFTLSFLGIMGLFAFNAGVYVWSNQRRSVAVEELQRAVARQALLSSIQLAFNDTQKQIGVLSQLASEADAAGATAAEKAQFASKLSEAEHNIVLFRRLLKDTPTVVDFQNSFRQLDASWRVFYDNFGVNQTKAVTELAIRGEPLSRYVIQDLMPRVQSEENQRAQTAGENFRSASRISDQITLSIFLVSTIVALIAAWLIARDVSRGLTALKAGAAAVGAGDLNHRIALQQKDELGDLAHAFDDMSAHLGAARGQLTAAHEQEKRKSEDLAAALEELKKTQDKLLVQQKLASLGTLTAGIAHEIKNPLNFVTNFAEILKSLVGDLRASVLSQKDRIDPDELDFMEGTLDDVAVNASKIREHGRRADEIVKGMLMHSRGQKGQIQPTNLNSLVAEYVKLAYHGLRAQDVNFNLTIDEHYDPAIPEMNLVPHDLSRVILNIANNGAFAADQKARRAGRDFKPTLRVSTMNRATDVEIRIRDNGDGVPEEIRQKVFEPFFTTKPAGSGTGLGLSMSYEIIVQQHGGQLRVETEPGEFAEFIINLPRV